jgi:hypothetical protein
MSRKRRHTDTVSVRLSDEDLTPFTKIPEGKFMIFYRIDSDGVYMLHWLAGKSYTYVPYSLPIPSIGSGKYTYVFKLFNGTPLKVPIERFAFDLAEVVGNLTMISDVEFVINTLDDY